MTVQLEWPKEVVDRLRQEAQECGLSLDDYLLKSASEAAKARLRRKEAGEAIRELRKGNILGPDLTIRDLIEEGRRF